MKQAIPVWHGGIPQLELSSVVYLFSGACLLEYFFWSMSVQHENQDASNTEIALHETFGDKFPLNNAHLDGIQTLPRRPCEKCRRQHLKGLEDQNTTTEQKTQYICCRNAMLSIQVLHTHMTCQYDSCSHKPISVARTVIKASN